MNTNMLRIGQVARGAGVGTKAIRFYEARGVIPPPARGENGYRLYPPETIEVLRFVKQAQGLGLTLDEIREIVAIRHGGRAPCAHVHDLLERKAVELDRKLEDLLLLRRRLRESLAAWGRPPRGPATICPHIETGSPRG
jgi:DNA-binding transcriptional MerR regulator